MSEDIPTKDLSGGYIVLPRKIRLAVLGAVIVAVFGLGGWITVMQIGVSEAKAAASDARDDVEEVKDSVRRIERHLCLECRYAAQLDAKKDCSEICVVRRRMRMEAR